MTDLPADLWIFMAAATFAGSVGAWAYFGSTRKAEAFAHRLASTLGGSVEGSACRVETSGLSFLVRKTVERNSPHCHRDVLLVTLPASCPAWFTLVEQDMVLERVANATDGLAPCACSDWRLPGFRMDTASPAWARRWLAQADVRERLLALIGNGVTLLRLRPDGVECRSALDAREGDLSGALVTPILSDLAGLVASTHDFAPELVAHDERNDAFEDRHGPLMFPLAVLGAAALAFLPVVSLTEGQPSLPWGVELEMMGAASTAFLGLRAYRPRLKARLGARENLADIYLSAMLMMGVGLLLLGAMLSRPLAYLFA